MKKPLSVLLLLPLLLCIPGMAAAGPYPPAAGEPSSTAIHMYDPAFVAWATGWENYLVGHDVSSTFQMPDKALGPAAGTSFDIVCLGRGGEITLTFDLPIKNHDGWDFAVFENSFSDTFLELTHSHLALWEDLVLLILRILTALPANTGRGTERPLTSRN